MSGPAFSPSRGSFPCWGQAFSKAPRDRLHHPKKPPKKLKEAQPEFSRSHPQKIWNPLENQILPAHFPTIPTSDKNKTFFLSEIVQETQDRNSSTFYHCHMD